MLRRLCISNLLMLGLGSCVILSAGLSDQDKQKIEEKVQRKLAFEKAKLAAKERSESPLFKILPESSWQYVPDLVRYSVDWVIKGPTNWVLTNIGYRVMEKITFGILDMISNKMVTRAWHMLAKPQVVLKTVAPKNLTIESLIFAPEVAREIENAVKMLGHLRRFPGRANPEDMLLYGPSGTGKTTIARTIASMAGTNYYEISGTDLANATAEQMNHLIYKLEVQRQMMVVVIDECENFLRQRSAEAYPTHVMTPVRHGSEFSDAAVGDPLNKWLTFTSQPHPYLLFIYTTNYKDQLDDAMSRRMPKQLEVGLPGLEQRAKIIALYLKKIFIDDRRYDAVQRAAIIQCFTPEKVAAMAKQTEGFSPDNLSKLMNEIKGRSFSENEGIVTDAIINYSVQLDIKRNANWKRQGPETGTAVKRQ